MMMQKNVTLIGEETGGGYYGNSAMMIPNIKLPNSGLQCRLPLYRLVMDKTRPKGNGIMPDIFVPYDTTGSTWYYTQLRYTNVFTTFAFDFVQGKRTKWSSTTDFKRNFTVSDQVLNQLTAFAVSIFVGFSCWLLMVQ